MKLVSATAILSLCVVAPGHAVAAQPSGWYGGVAAGTSRVDMTTQDWNDATLITQELDTEATAYKVSAGYHFSAHFAGELSYIHFGDVKFTAYETGTAPSLWQTGKVFGKAKAQGMSVTGVASWPSGRRFAVFARSGILLWDTTMLSNPTVAGGTLALSDQQVLHDNGVNFTYGAGAELRVYSRWRVRLEWEHATVRFASTLDRGVDFPSLGVTLDF